MEAVLGHPITAALPDPGGLSGIGARVEAPITRAVESPWQAAVLANGIWTVILAPVFALGDHLLVWRTSADGPQTYETYLPLGVVAAGSHGDFVDTSNAWAPTVADVAARVVEYTRTRVDASESYAGAISGEFDDDTTPTEATVRGYITAGCQEVMGRAGRTITPRYYALAATAAAQHAAAAIEASVGEEDANDAFRWHMTSYVATLAELTAQVRAPTVFLA